MAKVERLKPGDTEGAAEQAETLALRGEGLIKVYGGRAVVDNVNVVVKPGEVVGFLGPNGAGKTTTFYMLVGLLKPDKARIMRRRGRAARFITGRRRGASFAS